MQRTEMRKHVALRGMQGSQFGKQWSSISLSCLIDLVANIRSLPPLIWEADYNKREFGSFRDILNLL